MASLREAQERYACHYLALAERTEPHLTGAEQEAWLERLELEHGNVRAVLHWAREGGAQEAGLRRAGAVWAEGQALTLEQAFALAPGEPSPA